jgi:hypothetical protein
MKKVMIRRNARGQLFEAMECITISQRRLFLSDASGSIYGDEALGIIAMTLLQI